MKIEVQNGTGDINLFNKEIELLLIDALIDSSLKEDIININPKSEIIFSSSNSTENIINKKRSRQLEKDFTSKLLFYIKEDDFEYGYENRVDQLVNEQFKINSLATKEWINKVYINNFTNPEILAGILRLIARFDPEDFAPEGKTMAIAALVHKNIEVQECGIRVFEAWGTLDSLDILENIKVQPSWLQEYLNKVKENITKKYAAVS